MLYVEASLDAEYWNHQYKNSQTGWDLKQVSPPIKAYIDQLTNKNLNILIAGCGNAYEAEYLYQQGFTNITLIDIAETVVQLLQQKYQHTSIKILNTNVFEHRGCYDLIIEQTLFCAINPNLRSAYVVTMHNLLNPNGKLVGVLFNRTFEKAGPPFGVFKAEYKQLFKPYFKFHTFKTCYNSFFKRQNHELFINFQKNTLT